MSLNFRSTLAIAVIVVTTAMPATMLFAHSGATGIVKERMDSMKEIARNMKILGSTVKGKVTFDQSKVAAAAASISDHAAKILDQFPEGSMDHPSEASEKIWSEWDKFADYANALVSAAKEIDDVSKTASDAEPLKAAFLKAAETCSGCHKSYREKQ